MRFARVKFTHCYTIMSVITKRATFDALVEGLQRHVAWQERTSGLLAPIFATPLAGHGPEVTSRLN